MVQRDSIYCDDFKHQNPIPNASRIGNLVVSGAIFPRDPETGKPAESLEDQCAMMFRHLRGTVEAAGGTPDNIIKITVWLKNPADRDAVNAEWTRMFPDPASRPARHTQKDVSDGPYLVGCDFMAVLD